MFHRTPDRLPLDSRAYRALTWPFRISVALLAVGLAAQRLPIFWDYLRPTKVNEGLWTMWGEAWEPFLNTADTAVAILFLLIAVAVCVTRHAWPALAVFPLWIFGMVMHGVTNEQFHPELIPFASAMRMLGPFALVMLLALPGGEPGARSIDKRRLLTAEWLMRAITAATFLAHGLEAMFGRGHFVDLIIRAGSEVGGMRIAEADARAIMQGIALVDIIVAALILVPLRMRTVALWMAFWGLLTAASRAVYGGWPKMDAVLIRVIHGGIPLALLLYWEALRQQSSTPTAGDRRPATPGGASTEGPDPAAP